MSSAVFVSVPGTVVRHGALAVSGPQTVGRPSVSAQTPRPVADTEIPEIRLVAIFGAQARRIDGRENLFHRPDAFTVRVVKTARVMVSRDSGRPQTGGEHVVVPSVAALPSRATRARGLATTAVRFAVQRRTRETAQTVVPAFLRFNNSVIRTHPLHQCTPEIRPNQQVSTSRY